MTDNFRRTKIVATLGPASSSIEMLRKMIAAGLNCARLNFSHGTVEDHQRTAALVRQAAREHNTIVGILADLQGPKIRIAKFKNGSVHLDEGAEFVLDAAMKDDAGDEHAVGIDYKELPQDVAADDVLLLDDGRLVLNVKRVKGKKIFCTVVVGGELSNNKGINRQGGGLSAPALTDKDKHDIKTAVAIDADYVAVSFPRCAKDINLARSLVEAAGGNAGIIAKIERLEAIVPKTLDEIIDASDGIMVARGDLGVEIGDAQIPAAQKRMIKRAIALNKPVITATQMMETMIHNVVPTRAEVSDVANAVIDNTDAVMLSAETATGDHPDLVIKTMAHICEVSEKELESEIDFMRSGCCFKRIDEAISMSAMFAAKGLHAHAIIALTESGSTPLWMSRERSGIPIFGLSRNLGTLGRMSIYKDVMPLYFDVASIENRQIKSAVVELLKNRRFVKDGNVLLITRGPQRGVHGGTNSLTIVKVGR